MSSFHGMGFFQAGRRQEGSRSKIASCCSQQRCSRPHPWETFYVSLINANLCYPWGTANAASQASCSLTDTAVAVCWLPAHPSKTLGCYIALKWWTRKSCTQRIQTTPCQCLKVASHLDPIKKNYPVWLPNKTHPGIRLNEQTFLVRPVLSGLRYVPPLRPFGYLYRKS